MGRIVTEGPTPEGLAVVLHDLAWLLPRTVGREPDARRALPSSELEVMRVLVRRPGLSVSEVAAQLRLQPANVSTAIRALEARGLLARARDDEDGRIVRLNPTARALGHRKRQEGAWGDALERALEELPRADAARLLAAAPALRSLAAALGGPAPG
jgi:DNA-binding MarR family transcriptional regulator